LVVVFAAGSQGDSQLHDFAGLLRFGINAHPFKAGDFVTYPRERTRIEISPGKLKSITA
jgi:hypothetical protein